MRDHGEKVRAVERGREPLRKMGEAKFKQNRVQAWQGDNSFHEARLRLRDCRDGAGLKRVS